VSEDFLSEVREDPRPEFADTVWNEPDPLPARRRVLPVLAAVAAAAAIALAFTLPAVRAPVRDFLDLFRVKRFAAVPVDPARLALLPKGELDFKTLIKDQVEVLEADRAPEAVDGVEAAEAAAGVAVQQPAALPEKASLAEVRVGYPGAFRVRLDTSKLESLARALGVASPQVSPAWNGASFEAQGWPVVALRYHRPEGGDFVLLQARAPRVTLPPEVDLAQLGTLGLRMAGMSAEEARIFARSIDWRSTLLVPIPAEGGSFREVDVNGAKGLLVTSYVKPKPGPDGSRERGHMQSVLLWSAGEKVFAVTGPGDGVLVLEMALSTR
jgi:hypothetical protein